jgi:uncharacterized protein (DUF1778 family)
MARQSPRKTTWLSIRMSEQEMAVIMSAAESLGKSVSRFVVERAYADAQAVLAEQSHFRLSEKKWREFCKALDAPPKNSPALRKLLREPGVFDD